jgi:hypothetical protein
MVMDHFLLANTLKNKAYREFNDLTLMQRQQLDQQRFNAYQAPQSEDPDEEWKSNAVRPITRNRVISIAAHITGRLIFPSVYAQNDQDEEDRDTATVMRDLMEWAADQSDYERTFVYSVIAALVNPAVIIHTEYAEVFRTIKEMQDDGSHVDKSIIDDVYSGFQDSVVPLDELWIADFYQHNIQKQPFLIRRRAIDYTVAEAKHGHHKAFKYVQPGVQVMLDDDSGLFYEQQDENLKGRLVEEVIYWNRTKDLMLTYCNGILVCDPDYPNPRADKQYPFSKTGFELIDEGQFFFYRSLVNKLGSDEAIVQTLYRMILDGAYLQIMPPTVVFGDEAITSSVVTPGAVTTLSENSKIQQIGLQNNLASGLSVLEKVESSMNESSVDPQQSGVANSKAQTAYEISRLEENAKVLLGLFGQMIGFLVRDFGNLRVSDILQYLTIGEVMELESAEGAMRFRSFLLPDKMVDGKAKTRKIEFDMDMPTDMVEHKDLEKMQYKLMEREGGMDGKTQIMKVNPELFRRRKFLLKVTPETVIPSSDNVKKALNLEEYDRAIANPLVDPLAITRDLLLGSYDKTKDDPDKYLKQQNPSLGSLIGADPAEAEMASGNSQTAMLTNQRQQESAAQLIKGGGA